LGGGIANTILKSRGYEVGKSLIDADSLVFAAKLKSKKIILPLDVVVSKKKEAWKPRVKSVGEVEEDDYIFDIGPETIRLYAGYIKKSATLVWNGPLGMFEDNHYKHGTLAVAQLIAARSTGKAFGVVGGGETVEALKMTKMMNHIDWVSTGGGAMLSYLGGEKMPGLKGIVK
jgi:phosphoglycerate kinase